MHRLRTRRGHGAYRGSLPRGMTTRERPTSVQGRLLPLWPGHAHSGVAGPAIGDQGGLSAHGAKVVRTFRFMPKYMPYDARAVLDAAADMRAAGVTPRFYQISAAVEALAMLTARKRPLVQMPTGCGKSVVMVLLASAMAKLDERLQLAVAHKEELVGRVPWADDPGGGLLKHFAGAGFDVHKEKAESYARPWAIRQDRHTTGRPTVVVGSVPTMQGKRRDKWRRDEWALMHVDECHHGPAQSWRSLITHWSDTVGIVGYTATPERSGMADLFDLVHYAHEPGGPPQAGMTVRQAQDAGWLVPHRSRVVTIRGWDLSHLRQRDVNDGAMERSLTSAELEQGAEAALAPLVRTLRLLVADRKTLVFAPGVDSAHKIAGWLTAHLEAGEVAQQHQALVAAGFDPEVVAETVATFGEALSTACITGKTPDAERDLAMRRFERWTPDGQGVQVMVGVGVFDEGVDVRDVHQAAFVCGTTSLTRYFQRLGRVLRPASEIAGQLGHLPTAAERRALIASSTKPEALVIHFAGHQASRHAIKFVTPARLLHTEYPELDLEELLDAEESGAPLSLDELRAKHDEARDARAKAAEEARAAFEAREKRRNADRARLVAQPAAYDVEELRVSAKAAKAARDAHAVQVYEHAKSVRKEDWQGAWRVQVPDSDWSRWTGAKRLPAEPVLRSPKKADEFASACAELRDTMIAGLVKLRVERPVAERIATAAQVLAEAWTAQGVRNEIYFWAKKADPSFQTPFEKHKQKQRFRRSKR